MTETELFFARTDRLASVLRLSQRELAEKIGVSAGSFFGYRTGRNRITNKAWAKLESAERAAGIAQAQPAPDPDIEVRSSHLNEIGPPYEKKTGTAAAPSALVEILRCQVAEKDRQIDRLLGLLEDLARDGKPPTGL